MRVFFEFWTVTCIAKMIKRDFFGVVISKKWIAFCNRNTLKLNHADVNIHFSPLVLEVRVLSKNESNFFCHILNVKIFCDGPFFMHFESMLKEHGTYLLLEIQCLFIA